LAASRAALPEGDRELLAQPLVLLAQAAELGVGRLQPLAQRGVGGPLARGDRRAGWGARVAAAEPLDLGA
jgi:hypothetical protein